MFSRKRQQNITGAFIAVNPSSGFVEGVLIYANNDREQIIIQGALARITRQDTWGWLRRLICNR